MGEQQALLLQDQIEQLTQKLFEWEHTQKRLAQLEPEHQALKNKLARQEAVLEQETADVTALKGLSFKSLLGRLDGSLGQSLAQEEREYMEARLIRDKLLDDLTVSSAAHIRLKSQLRSLGDSQELMASRTQLEAEAKVARDPAFAKILQQVLGQLTPLKARHREYGEAIAAGNDYLICADRLLSLADSFTQPANQSQDLEQWDMLNQVKVLLADLDYFLPRFQKELADINEAFDTQLHPTTSSFSFFMPGNKSMKTTRDNMRQLCAELEPFLDTLKGNMGRQKEEIKTLQKRYNHLVKSGNRQV